MKQEIDENRLYWIDVVRIVACCMIVLMHSPHPNAGNPGILLVPLSFITAAGIGLFFMVSGTLLLPVQTDTKSFLQKRFGKIAGPLLFWTLFYLGVSIISGEKHASSLPHALVSIPFSTQGHGILWFMYTLAGLYLLAPIISPFLAKASKHDVRFYLTLWAATLCFPIVANFADVNNSVTGALYYFSGYVGYFVLGFYMHTFKPHIPNYMKVLLLVMPIICLLAFKMLCKDGGLYDYFWYLSVFVVMMCIAWYDGIRSLMQRYIIGGGKLHIIKELSNCCFGVYLIHIFIMRYFLWHIDVLVYGLGGVAQIVLTWILTLAISFVLTYCISFLPYADYIIGIKKKHK